MMEIEAQLNLVVALPPEAKPINQILGLQRLQPDGELPIFIGDQVALVLTGHGIAATTRGVRYLHRLNRNRHGHWLNIGIAGHRVHALGQVIIASRVIDPGKQQSWTMPYLDLPDCLPGWVQTQHQPETEYSTQNLYDMEAAGFVCAALDYAPLANLQVVKIISDNRQSPTSGINAKMVTGLIQQKSPLIRLLVNRMIKAYD